MSDTINAGNISDSEAIAIGDGATATVTHNHLPDLRPKAFVNLPAYNPNFTGRAEQLEHIAATFAADAGRLVVTQAISGLGGVGKTQIALAYAYQHRDQYDVIWMLAADNTAALDSSLRELGEVMGLPVADKDTRTARQMVLNTLGNGEKQVLLLYDNADAIAPRDLLAYLPSGGHLLITSRRDNSQWRGMAQTVTLGTFTPAEAMDFWRGRVMVEPEVGLLPRAGVIDDEKARLLDYQALAKTLGYLPLAMEQAAALMLHRRMTPTAYLTAFQKDYAKIQARESVPNRYHATVMTTWEMAFEQARRTEGAADLLNLCSFFAPDNIPLQVIQDGADLLPSELAAVMADEEWGVGDALAALQSYSLLTVTDGDKLAMHRLVQLVARERMQGSGGAGAKEWVDVALKVLSNAYNFDQQDMSTWTQSGKLLPHLVTATDLAEEYNVNNEQCASLNNWVGIYLDIFGDYEAAYPFYKRALSIREEMLADDPDNEDLLKSTATSLNNMGFLLNAMGDLQEARPFYEQALAINKKVLGDDHPDTATSFGQIGNLLYTMGQLEEALPFTEKYLAITQKALGDDHPTTANCMNEMGGLLRRMGKLEEARPFYEQALAIRKKALGDDHPDTANSLNNMGFLLQAMGDLQAARPFYEQALATNKKSLGDDHPDTAYGYNNLAILSYYEGDMQTAARLMRRALLILEKALGDNHPRTQKYRETLSVIEAAL